MPSHPIGCKCSGDDRDLMAADPIPRGKMITVGVTVFLVAIAVRLTSLGESLWVDELHSAWCIGSSFGDVIPRAKAGHQSPAYFAAIWVWKQIVGESEFSLRLSSVIAVATASAILTVGIAKWTRCLAAGVVAGLMLSLESNSLFFGTELRPYAFVILFSTFATVCFVKLSAVASRHCARIAWFGLVMSIVMAMLFQPTSLGALAWLPVVLGITWVAEDFRAAMKFSRGDVVLFAATTLSAIFLWQTTLGQSWSQRQEWASFATATHLGQLWNAWNWTWLLIIPVALIAIGRSPRRIPLTLAIVAVLATTGYWIVSWLGWLPLWHRRYFVAVLPMLAAVVGCSIASISDRDQKLGWLTAIAMLLGLGISQGTLPRLLKSTTQPVVVRGEDWRSAIQWIVEKADEGDRIYLDGGLIEGRATSSNQATADFASYLKYPISGPYRVAHVVLLASPNLQEVDLNSSHGIFILTRRPVRQINPGKFLDAKIMDFGGVSVIALPGAG